MSRWLANNLGLMALALVLASAVWVLTTMQEDPIVEGDVEARVQVEAPDQLDIVLSSTVPNTVTVRVRAPRSTLQALAQPGNALVTVDLRPLAAGEHVIGLLPVLQGEPYSILSSKPLTTAVKLERLVQRSFPVRVSSIGTPALGYQARDGRAEVATATITATEAVLDRVQTVDAIVSIDDVRSNVQQRVRLAPRDRDSNIVSGISIAPSESLVTVPIEQLSNYRTLAVSVKTRGLPAESYAITSILAEPQIVTVFGNKDEIQKLPGFIETLDVNVDGVTNSVEDRVGLKVPAGVTLVGDDFSVQVRIRVEAQQGARTVTREPIVIGLPSVLRATASPEVIEVRLSGPLPRLNSLTAQEVRVLLDVTNLPIGVHQVAPTLVKPDAIRAEISLPTIQVEIKEAPAGRQ